MERIRAVRLHRAVLIKVEEIWPSSSSMFRRVSPAQVRPRNHVGCSAIRKLPTNRLLGGVDSPCGSSASRPLKTGVLGIASAGRLGADAAPRLANDIIITMDDERLVILRWRRLATRESPRTAAGPRHSCAGHRCVGP